MIDVTDQDFEQQVIEKSHEMPVIVDLWAPWCEPCKTLGPLLEQVIDAQGGKVLGVKINVDENPGVSQAFQVQSIPMVVAFKDGQAVDGFMGAIDQGGGNILHPRMIYKLRDCRRKHYHRRRKNRGYYPRSVNL